MTKIYLVTAHEVLEDGRMKVNGESRIQAVYTNKKLAERASEAFNEKWSNGFKTGDFKNVWWYSVRTYVISHYDWGEKI